MNNNLTLKPIAYIKTDFKEKFGIPRQSGRIKSALGEIVFYKEYSNPDAIRGLEEFNYLWVIFDFTLSHTDKFEPTVRPPRLGGNKKVGVFASRSPFRPNPLGLSSFKIEKIISDKSGVKIIVSGVDLLDGTVIYDVKPYLKRYDCHTDALNGFAEKEINHKLKVEFPENLLNLFPDDKKDTLLECLSDDPRPSYQEDGKIYGLAFNGLNVKFSVEKGKLKVLSVE